MVLHGARGGDECPGEVAGGVVRDGFIQEGEILAVLTPGLRVSWEWVGEGLGGDYDPGDPNDVPLLRFCVDRVVRDAKGAAVLYEEMSDASYCTQLPVGTPERVLLRAAALLLEAAGELSPKRRFEELSWMCPSDFAEGGKWWTR